MNHFTPPTKEELIMSKDKTIYPMAFVPNKELSCKIHYIGFPKRWKEILLQIEKKKPNWFKEKAFPTVSLKNGLNSWMPEIVDIKKLCENSNDEKWLISYGSKINIQMLFQHIVIWINANYLKEDGNIEVKELLDTMKVEELAQLQGEEMITLFDKDGFPTEKLSFSILPLMIVKNLVGKTIEIDGHEVSLFYAGKNELISDIQNLQEDFFSYGISFSLQTLPSNERPLLLCNCCIHRWIRDNWKEEIYLKENITAHIWMGKDRIYKIPIEYDNNIKGYNWKKVAKKYYNLYNFQALPLAGQVITKINTYLLGERKITFLYKNGMDNRGFCENKIGTGVSLIEKKQIFEEIFPYIFETVDKIEDIKFLTRSVPTARKKLKVDEIHLNHVLTKEDMQLLATRIQTCIQSNHLVFEVYYRENEESCAKEIMQKLKDIFQDTKQIKFEFHFCKLQGFGEPLEESVHKRINEIRKKLEDAKEVTACMVLLPNKEYFSKIGGDPKQAIRKGFALKKRLTQFIVPWEIDKSKKGWEKLQSEVDNKIISAIEDLCRQLGYLRQIDEKLIENEKALAHAKVIGMHFMHDIQGRYGKADYLPLTVEVDYIDGNIYVCCDAFENRKVLYKDACFELSKLTEQKDFKSKCKDATDGYLKKKLSLWKKIYGNENVLILVESNKNTRKLFPGINNNFIHKYSYKEKYVPEEIEVGTKDKSYFMNLNKSNLRIIRIRNNAEVPDYYTESSKKNPEQLSSTSGIFCYEDVFWSLAGRPNDKSYKRSYIQTTYQNSEQKFSHRNMIEFYPLQLQEKDCPEDWINYTNSLREGSIQYDFALIDPMPLHLAKKLEEYL